MTWKKNSRNLAPGSVDCELAALKAERAEIATAAAFLSPRNCAAPGGSLSDRYTGRRKGQA